LAKRNYDFRAAATELYSLLLKPAQAQLSGKDNLIIVPEMELWNLPFQALVSGSGRYVIQDYALSYSPSLTVLREMAKARKKEKPFAATLLAFGNPTLRKDAVDKLQSSYRDERLSPLPEAEQEVKELAQLYGPKRSQILIGAEAREDRMKADAGKFRILHLATHGILDDASPMYSYVVMAQPDRNSSEDGLLEAREIMNLDLNADLVVLSACETARGRIGAGEGVIGLTWAVFVAGCPTTVVSQWSVESASTTELMKAFHSNLNTHLQRSSSPATSRALQSAALSLLQNNKYNHPFYWAGFVVVGDGR
jgi:CHAT domain-containing protein